ncbi:hypothetical protein VUR80DRAFT_8704 [Thermomyces stellatus]
MRELTERDKSSENGEYIIGTEGSCVLVPGLLASEEYNGQYLSNYQVATATGQRVQKKFCGKLLEVWEKIEPGISSNL